MFKFTNNVPTHEMRESPMSLFDTFAARVCPGPECRRFTTIKPVSEKRQAALSLFRKLSRDRKAVTALEYGLIASMIAVAIIGSVGHLGTNIASTFTFIAGKL